MKISIRDESSVLQVIDLCSSLRKGLWYLPNPSRSDPRSEDARSLSTMAPTKWNIKAIGNVLKDVCAAGAVPEVFDEPNATWTISWP